jgi:hypothetical protein
LLHHLVADAPPGTAAYPKMPPPIVQTHKFIFDVGDVGLIPPVLVNFFIASDVFYEVVL